jgi:hypothetical protein
MNEPTLQEALEVMLPHFTGTLNYHRFWLKGIYYTDGVQYLAEKARAYWLIDAIASHQMTPKVRQEEFQVWALHKAAPIENPTEKHIAAILICTDRDKGNGPAELARQNIPYTDFPLDAITLYLEQGSLDGEYPCQILMLPSER